MPAESSCMPGAGPGRPRVDPNRFELSKDKKRSCSGKPRTRRPWQGVQVETPPTRTVTCLRAASDGQRAGGADSGRSFGIGHGGTGNFSDFVGFPGLPGPGQFRRLPLRPRRSGAGGLQSASSHCQPGSPRRSLYTQDEESGCPSSCQQGPLSSEPSLGQQGLDPSRVFSR